MNELTEEEMEEMLANPFYAVNILPNLAMKHEPLTSKENWIKVNANLIDEIGKEEWLKRLLSVLEFGGPQGGQVEIESK